MDRLYYDQGREAYYSGQNEEFCPYSAGTKEHIDWMRGFYGKRR